MKKCEHVDTVSDADFGYWDEIWGPPDVQEFPCEEDAAVIVQLDTPVGPESVALCATHAKDVL